MCAAGPAATGCHLAAIPFPWDWGAPRGLNRLALLRGCSKPRSSALAFSLISSRSRGHRQKHKHIQEQLVSTQKQQHISRVVVNFPYHIPHPTPRRQKYIEEQLAARLGKSAAQQQEDEQDPEVRRKKVG